MLNICPADRTRANVFISSLTQVMDAVEIHMSEINFNYSLFDYCHLVTFFIHLKQRYQKKIFKKIFFPGLGCE